METAKEFGNGQRNLQNDHEVGGSSGFFTYKSSF